MESSGITTAMAFGWLEKTVHVIDPHDEGSRIRMALNEGHWHLDAGRRQLLGDIIT